MLAFDFFSSSTTRTVGQVRQGFWAMSGTKTWRMASDLETHVTHADNVQARAERKHHSRKKMDNAFHVMY